MEDLINNEEAALNYIINKMEKVDEYDMMFKYELIKEEQKGYEPDQRILNQEIPEKIKTNLPILKLIENSLFLSSKIYAKVAQMNIDENNNEEINFKKLEANIIIDLSFVINNENKYYNMLMICGLVYALNSLKIRYTLSAIGDSDFQVRIKNLKNDNNTYTYKKI